MGQKVNPTGFRTGITEDWKSKWYAPKAAYGTFLVEDHKVRRLIDAKLNRRPPFAAVSDILIERTREEVTVTIKTARPGLVIGPKGAEVDKLREQIEDMIHRKVAPVKVIEVKNPDLNAQLVAEGIAEQLKKRASGMVEKVIRSAVANANEQEVAPRNTLYVAKAWADPGPIIKRFQPKDRGKAYPIMKRTSHLEIALDERATSKPHRPKPVVGGRPGKAR